MNLAGGNHSTEDDRQSFATFAAAETCRSGRVPSREPKADQPIEADARLGGLNRQLPVQLWRGRLNLAGYRNAQAIDGLSKPCCEIGSL